MSILKIKIGTEIYSTSQNLIGEIEVVNEKTIDIRCETWQTKNAIVNNILVRFHKAYLTQGHNEVEMCQKSPEDKEAWGLILKG